MGLKKRVGSEEYFLHNNLPTQSPALWFSSPFPFQQQGGYCHHHHHGHKSIIPPACQYHYLRQNNHLQIPILHHNYYWMFPTNSEVFIGSIHWPLLFRQECIQFCVNPHQHLSHSIHFSLPEQYLLSVVQK